MRKPVKGLIRLAWMSAILAVLASTAPSYAGWTVDEKGLAYSSSSGTGGKTFGFESRGLPNFLSVTGGVCGRGEFAWLDRREGTITKAIHSFKFFGENGQVLWEKNVVVGSTVAKNCDAVVLMESTPAAIAQNEHGNAPSYPRVYDRLGRLILDLGCKQHSPYAQLEERFGSVSCWPENPKEGRYRLLFDVQTRRTKRVAGDSGIEIYPDGTYVLFTRKQSFDPETKKYGAFVRTELGKGSFD